MIDTVLAGIQTRVNQLDGTGLADPAESTVNQIVKELNGLRETLNQVSVGLEADRQDLRTDLDNLISLVNQHLSAIG